MGRVGSMAVVCQVTLAAAGASEPVRPIEWADLRQAVEFDDPFASLSEDQLSRLGLLVCIRNLIAAGKTSVDGREAQEMQRLEAGLRAERIDVEALLAVRERIADLRQARAESVNTSLDATNVRIAGYMLPQRVASGRTEEFLLVPWVSACSHGKQPEPNQMIQVVSRSGIRLRGLSEAIWVEGRLEYRPQLVTLFHIDGTREMRVGYTMMLDRDWDYVELESGPLSRIARPPRVPGLLR